MKMNRAEFIHGDKLHRLWKPSQVLKSGLVEVWSLYGTAVIRINWNPAKKEQDFGGYDLKM